MPRLELNVEPTAHSTRHALLHMVPKWSSYQTTWAGRKQDMCIVLYAEYQYGMTRL